MNLSRLTPARERLVWLAATGVTCAFCIAMAELFGNNFGLRFAAAFAGAHFGACCCVSWVAWMYPPIWATARCPHAMLWCGLLSHDWRYAGTSIPGDGTEPIDHFGCQRCHLMRSERRR